MTCSVDSTNKAIIFSSGLSVAVTPGNPIAVSFGPVTNPITTNPILQPSLGTFTIQTYVDASQQYKIDAVLTGLPPNIDCIYPCRTCSSSLTTAG